MQNVFIHICSDTAHAVSIFVSFFVMVRPSQLVKFIVQRCNGQFECCWGGVLCGPSRGTPFVVSQHAAQP